MQRFVFAWAAVLTWAAVIYILSDIPSLQSGLPTMLDVILRKAAHIIEYAILSWLLFRAIPGGKDTRFVAAFLVALLYAFSDEFHQLFVAGRSGTVTDVMIDSAGVLAGVIVPHILYRNANNRKAQ